MSEWSREDVRAKVLSDSVGSPFCPPAETKLAAFSHRFVFNYSRRGYAFKKKKRKKREKKLLITLIIRGCFIDTHQNP